MLRVALAAACLLGVTPARASWAWSRDEVQRLHAEAEAAMIRGDVAGAADRYREACKRRRELDLGAATAADHPLLLGGNPDQSFLRAGRIKLRHDAEQLEHLLERGLVLAKPYGLIARVFRNFLGQLPQTHIAVDVQPGSNKFFDRAYNRALHLTWPGRLAKPALRGDFDAGALERRFRERELPPEAGGCEAQNGVTHADGLLSEEALEGLHRWCLESTMWFASRPGYVAAFFQEAFNAPLIVQVAEELRQALPTILGEHKLMNMWAFKYAHNASDWPIQGTAVHADVAAVNVNMWLTDDSANEDPEGGGLTIYTKQAPREWGFADYNSLEQVPRIKAFLNDSGRVVVPHRRNRVVLFNSNLFHETQIPRFRPGYANRRINLTFLFGRRCGGDAGANEGAKTALGRAKPAGPAAAAATAAIAASAKETGATGAGPASGSRPRRRRRAGAKPGLNPSPEL